MSAPVGKSISRGICSACIQDVFVVVAALCQMCRISTREKRSAVIKRNLNSGLRRVSRAGWSTLEVNNILFGFTVYFK